MGEGSAGRGGGMERQAIPEVEAAFHCSICGWAENAESFITRSPELHCPRCQGDGVLAVTEPAEIRALHLVWCRACQTHHIAAG